MTKKKSPPASKKARPDPEKKEPEKKSVKEPPGKKVEDKRPLPPLPQTESEKKSEKQDLTDSSPESSPPGTEEEETLLDQQDILEICKEIPDLLFQIWKRFDPEIELLTDPEKSRISKPLARIVYRKNFDKWVKDEFYLVFLVGLSISKRIKIKKKNVKDNSRKTGPGKDDVSR